jgi:hypothetical protein
MDKQLTLGTLSMKWTVLGFLAVFLAQSGFIAYTALERQSDEFVAANGVPAGNDTFADAPFDLSGLDSTPIGAGRDPGTVNTGVITVSAVERRKARRSAGPYFLTARNVQRFVPATAADFEPRIITIPAPQRAEQPRAVFNEVSSVESQAYYKPASQPEKRSFVSKSVSVIKKPYDWLILIASKLR